MELLTQTPLRLKKRSLVYTFDCDSWNLNLHLILGRRNNFLIDTGLGSACIKPILPFLRQNPKPLIVVNTHFHYDHLWGNCLFKSSTIVSSPLCRQLAELHWGTALQDFYTKPYGTVEKCLPNLVFEGELLFPEDNIRIFHSPGHTADGISLLDEEDGILNAGDNVGDTMEQPVPFLENPAAYLATLETYQSLPFDCCVSGHNGIVDKSFFTLIQKQVEKISQAGK